MTKSCKAALQVQFLECKGCDCQRTLPDRSKVKEYVKINIEHRLTEVFDGCKPWFTVVDSGLRAFVSATRDQIVSEKLKKCGYK